MKWKIGDRINNDYEIFDIKKGGFGIVYLVYSHESKSPYAIKTYPIEMYKKYNNFKDDFYRECNAWTNLGFHPNITNSNAIVKLDGRPYLFLEYVNGGNLHEFIQKTSLNTDIRLFLQLCLDFCAGMTHALTSGIVAHNDIKPSNLLLTDALDLKITDFGLSFVKDEFKNSDSIIGTLPYMSPESFDADSTTDIRSDIYSFGITMYEMIAKAPPYLGQTSDDFEYNHKNKELPALGCDKDIFSIIKKCTSKAPADRYQNIAALKLDLDNLYKDKFGNAYEPNHAVLDMVNLEAVKKNQAGNYVEIGDYEKAIKLCEELIDSSNDNNILSWAWNDLGCAKGSEIGDWSPFLYCFKNAVKHNPKNEIAWHNLGYSYRQSNEIKKAIESYEKSIELNPLYIVPYNNLGYVLMHHTSNYAKAEKVLLEAKKVNPSHLLTNLNLASLYSNFLTDLEKSIYYFEKILEIEPWHENAMIKLMFHYVGSKKYKKALELIERLNSLNVSSLENEPTFWITCAIVYNNLSLFKEAEKSAYQAIRIDSSNVEALMQLAHSIKNMNNSSLGVGCTSKETNDKLILVYNKVIKIDPKHSEAYRLKGVSLIGLGRYEDAIGTLKIAADINPKNADTFNDLGLAYRKISDFEQAINSCAQAIEIAPDNEMYYYNLADFLIDLKDFKSAIKLFEKAIELRNNYPEAWHSLGICYKSIEDLEMAENCYRMTLIYSPNHKHVWFSLGNLNVIRENYAKAIECYKKAMVSYSNYNDLEGCNHTQSMITAILNAEKKGEIKL
ncbi:MAG: tetratricopeptide repeat protein [Lewinellaceae bacterium]|nr:tetratricopeptide repeat protein [Lewinellaceae bacterium]